MRGRVVWMIVALGLAACGLAAGQPSAGIFEAKQVQAAKADPLRMYEDIEVMRRILDRSLGQMIRSTPSGSSSTGSSSGAGDPTRQALGEFTVRLDRDFS